MIQDEDLKKLSTDFLKSALPDYKRRAAKYSSIAARIKRELKHRAKDLGKP